VDSGSDRPFSAHRRESVARAQDRALPGGAAVISCSAPLGNGGLGRHLREAVDALARREQPTTCISGSTRGDASPPAAGTPRHVLGIPYLHNALSRLRLPVSPGVRTHAFMVEFDAYAASRLPLAEHLIAFNGQALAQFRVARTSGFETIALVSANSHMRGVARQHALAHRQYPLEGSWAAHLLRRNLSEYAQAARIYVASRYIRESFLEEGFSEEKLSDFPLTPDPRFEPSRDREVSDRFEIVYVGSLAVHKGVPLLIDAIRRLPHTDMRLVLVGSWGTRGMRRFIQQACADDRRIEVRPGDPLPYLRRSRLYVHPAYEEGFGYSAAEALACGVPVIVSEDTGMKDMIDGPRTGLVLPTGDLDALTETIDAAYRGEILAGQMAG
jgi:glycosyltransferase involved in cell wall biosynthesis